MGSFRESQKNPVDGDSRNILGSGVCQSKIAAPGCLSRGNVEGQDQQNFPQAPAEAI